MRNLELGPGSNWWVDQKLNCGNCGTRFILDVNDGDKIRYDREHERGIMGFVMGCPGCRRTIFLGYPGYFLGSRVIIRG